MMRKLLPFTVVVALMAGGVAPTVASDSNTESDTKRGSMNHGDADKKEHRGSTNHGDADKKEHRGSANHDEMMAPDNVNEAEAKGKINTIDADAGVVNVTHEPVEALGWPTMTMDLPVTRRVDLSTVKPGADVTFKLKKGRDKKFRIVEISPSE